MFRYFKDLDKLANALHVKHFATMDSELEYIDSQDLAIEVLAWMEANDFDIVPVRKNSEESFFIDREKDLKNLANRETIANRMKPIPFSKLVKPDELIKVALKELSERGWFFVGTDNVLEGIVTLADLGKPTVSFYLLSHLLMLEAGLRRLLGSYTSDPIPDAAIEHGDSFTTIINKIKKEEKLVSNLGFSSKTNFGNYTGFMGELRNALAHGRSILSKSSSVIEATEYINKIDFLLRKVEELINDRPDVWDKFAETHVVKHTKQNWAGTNAMPDLPMNPPIYVISAANPLEEVLPSKDNKKRHLGLHAILESRKLKFEEVFGESPNEGKWSEASFAIEGMSKKDACELAKKFGQRAIFELTQDEMRVISVDGECRKNKPRCR